MRPPLLFVHGASLDSRIWSHGFADFFARQGWDCRLLDLPGHGYHQRRPDLHSLGLKAYREALGAAVAACPCPPVVIGHSMGGYLAQSFVLQGGCVHALVLLASAPPQGMARELLHFVMRHPLLALRLDLAGGQGDRTARLKRVRTMLLTESTPQSVVEAVADILQPESNSALLELGMQALPQGPLGVPLQVLAGGQDQLISAAASRGLAQRYGVEAVVYPDMAHMLQIEPGWQTVAADALAFIERSEPSGTSRPPEKQVGAA